MSGKTSKKADEKEKQKERDKEKTKKKSSDVSKKGKRDKGKEKPRKHKDEEKEPPKKKKKRVSFRDPLERSGSDSSPTSRRSAHKVISSTIVNLSDMLLNPACQVELLDDPVFSFNGGLPRPCMQGVRLNFLCVICLFTTFLTFRSHFHYRTF